MWFSETLTVLNSVKNVKLLMGGDISDFSTYWYIYSREQSSSML